ncbi:type II toxin-antitoxin system death-on-curing family toxin [Piscirickettsia litoralis]|uniref:Fido domain-containing protein n=1 Tax=Piscirickettsia litoralis TaxID=1891921 RepID=A0ABX3A3S0_9GAMM|nr:type II toxin-antitoxin system death-on-curing family toxin [Piscirickettsia litoralis]ODN42005.1 hypothetical protein BGC07_02325 [Piscirickettsia litoralis]
MEKIIWLTSAIIIDIQNSSLNSGEDKGIRDRKLLEAAVAGVENAYGYYEHSSELDYTEEFYCAAQYAFKIGNFHPFYQANKRTAFISALTFLRMNGIVIREMNYKNAAIMTYALVASDTMGGVEVTVELYASWLNCFKVKGQLIPKLMSLEKMLSTR